MPKDDLMDQLRGKPTESKVKTKEPSLKEMEAMFKGDKLDKKMR
jgi:hypothetical protein